MEVGVKSIKSLIEDVPIREILNTAEIISGIVTIPGLPLIIKALRILLVAQPAVSGIAGLFVQQPTSNEEKLKSDSETFDLMWKMATADNVITDEEMQFLQPYALAAGIPHDKFGEMVTKFNRNQNN